MAIPRFKDHPALPPTVPLGSFLRFAFSHNEEREGSHKKKYSPGFRARRPGWF
jgi:hypothetical protein